jgi:hypothetical protein
LQWFPPTLAVQTIKFLVYLSPLKKEMMSYVSPGLTLVNPLQSVTMSLGLMGDEVAAPLPGWTGVLDVVGVVVDLEVVEVEVDVVLVDVVVVVTVALLNNTT